jgi:hypothetical protein
MRPAPDVTPEGPVGPGGERLHAAKRRNGCVDYDRAR